MTCFFASMFRYVLPAGVMLAGAGSAVYRRYTDSVRGNTKFAMHTNEQHRKHFISGMQEPFIPVDTTERAIFDQHFSQFSCLLPQSPEDFFKRKTISAPVCIKPLSMCSRDLIGKQNIQSGGTVVVGGPPALISSAQQSPLIYINDSQQIAIATGSAHHLEWDSPSEGPTTLQPVQFMATQIWTLLFPPKMSEAESTGHFPWSTLDWKGWIRHPSKWAEGVRLAVAFQKATMDYQAVAREAVLTKCQGRCRSNQAFYEQLNKDMVTTTGVGLFVPGVQGSLLVARTAEESIELRKLRDDLKKEDRELREVSEVEFRRRFGFSSSYMYPNGMVMEKTHDKLLQPHFMQAVMDYLAQKGSTIIDGRVTAVYTDDPEKGGYVEYTPYSSSASENSVLVPFTRLIMSLGAQRVHTVDASGKVSAPVLDVVSARGVSSLAIAYVPQPMDHDEIPRSVPPVILCGDTNDCVVVSGPVAVVRNVDNKQQKCHAYLLKVTTGACISPNVLEPESTHYHAVSAVGMLAAVQSTLGCDVQPVAVWGCNRQTSQYGETHWLEASSNVIHGGVKVHDCGSHRPKKTFEKGGGGIFVQVGAAGGGLTQAPAQPPDYCKVH